MIKLKDLLNEIVKEDSGEVFNPPKGRWMEIDPKAHKEELDDEFFKLISTAYQQIGGHAKIKGPGDVFNEPKWTYWKGIDIHGDPDFDVIVFGQKTPYGIKFAGVGHDGERDSKKAYMQAKSDELKLDGHYGEVSGKLAQNLMGAGVPAITDKAEVEKVLGKPVEWHGKHPTDSSMPGEGWYTREIGGTKHEKILVGKPKV